MAQPTCFVIMGFGKKTDYGEMTRTLDLDATYRAIIKPAVQAANVRCIRADEVSKSGVIDKTMYEHLLQADLVIADISTANANALYELGVRHALRPRSTIVIKEVDGKFHFDLNHVATLQYKHLGEDIGWTEAETKRQELQNLIKAVLAQRDTDSPVYTFLPLTEPTLRGTPAREEALAPAVATGNFAALLEAARRAASESRHEDAARQFAAVYEIQKLATQPGSGGSDPFVVQQWALATYKSKMPSLREALDGAWRIIQELAPDTSTDPETLGIAGAIQKRLWEATQDPQHLERALELYGRGFEVKQDYYNGENYALCLDMRAAMEADPDEARYHRKTARKVRLRVVESLKRALGEASAKERPDYEWMVATMANVHFALGDVVTGETWEGIFNGLKPAHWKIETFQCGKKGALEVAAGPSA